MAVFVRPANADNVNNLSEVRIFNQLLSHTRFSLNPFLPSAWMAQAVFSWSGGLAREGGFFLLPPFEQCADGRAARLRGGQSIFLRQLDARLRASLGTQPAPLRRPSAGAAAARFSGDNPGLPPGGRVCQPARRCARAQGHARFLARPGAVDAGHDLLRPADDLRVEPAQRRPTTSRASSGAR